MADVERQVDADPRELVLPLLPPRQDFPGVADAEPDHVADSMREEQADRAPLHEPRRLAAQQTEIGEALSDHERRCAVDVSKLGAHSATLGCCDLRAPHELPELFLLRREAARDGIRSRDVARVAAVL